MHCAPFAKDSTWVRTGRCGKAPTGAISSSLVGPLIVMRFNVNQSIIDLVALSGGSAHTSLPLTEIALWTARIWDSRRGQLVPSAMERSRPGGTAFMITVDPLAR